MQQHVAATFRRLTSGVYVVGVADRGRRDAFTAAWVMQVSFRPPLVALSVNPANLSHGILVGGGGFAVSVLERGRLDLARRFGTRTGTDVDKLVGIAWRAGRTGAPILEEAIAFLDCRLEARHPAGDHELMIGRAVEGAVLRPEAAPITHAETGEMDGSTAMYPAGWGESGGDPVS
ncbi:MAG TPA: flavin reductase family protein [Gemmatimonadales bacterium]|nr:flavin reductase family protein [Gemmatimonadales bacterium]